MLAFIINILNVFKNASKKSFFNIYIIYAYIKYFFFFLYNYFKKLKLI